MKLLKYCFLITVGFTLIVSGCKKDFLDTAPQSSVDAEQVFTSPANVSAALNGVYRLMFEAAASQDQFGEGTMKIYADMLGEDVVNTTQGNGWFISHTRWISPRVVNGASTDYAYFHNYRVINNVNQIINRIDGVPGTPEEKNPIKGEALALRAHHYFTLVQFYGKRYDAAAMPNSQLGVPLLLQDSKEGLPRATVEEVYASINKDLDSAIQLLPTASFNETHINLNVAKGIKARVALAMQEWATAAQYASEARQGYSLMSNDQYKEGFTSMANPEWMWASSQISDQTGSFAAFYAYMSATFNSTNIRSNPKAINSKLYDQISVSDVRKQMWDPTGASVPVPPRGSKLPYIQKKFLTVNSGASYGDIPHMRVAEMFLIEAEANARQDKNMMAQDALFTLMENRDSDYTRSTSTGQTLIDEIMIHRRVELWGEGFRFFDLKRTNSRLDRTGANHNASVSILFEVEPGDVKWQWVFPEDEINANPAIVQNPL